MPQNDRHRTRVVPIEFEAHENFTGFPFAERVSIVLITNGKASFILNEKAVTLTAPCVMLISQYDKLKLVESNRLAAKSFSFNPVFMNSALTFERLRANDFFELEELICVYQSGFLLWEPKFMHKVTAIGLAA